MLRGSLVVATCVAVAFASGCNGGECGPGTLRYGDECVLVDPFDKTPPHITVDPPLYTRQVGTVHLKSDKPATIYYTIDGTSPTESSPSGPDELVIPNVPDNAQLRYFAIDLAGNRSPEELRIWIIDRDGPGPLLDFRAAVAGTDRTVTWAMPPDPRPGGVLIARVEGRLGTQPVSGQQYQVGDTLSPGVTIVATSGADATGMFTETRAAPPGLVRYVGWAYDDLDNYGPPAGDYAVVAAPVQTAHVVVAAGAGTVTVANQPSNLYLAGTAQLSGTTLTVNLTLRNDTTRVLFAPKILVTSALPTGITLSNQDGVLATFPYRAYGAVAMPANMVNADWTFAGATSSTQLALDLEIRDNYIMMGSPNYGRDTAGAILDAVTGNDILDLGPGALGPGGSQSTPSGGFTPDGQLVIGARTAGVVSSFDLSVGKRILNTTLMEQRAQVPLVALDRSGTTVYAVVANGHPQKLNTQATGSPTQLVRLDAGTLTEFPPRLDLGTSRNGSIAISPDGKTMIISSAITSQGVIVIDLTTFQIKTRIMTAFRPQCALFTPDGSSIVIVGEQIGLYALDGTPQMSFTTPGSAGGKVRRAAFTTSDLLWIGRRDLVANINLTTGATTELSAFTNGGMLDVFDGKAYITTTSYPRHLQRLDAAGNVDMSFGAEPVGLAGHWIGRSPF